MSIKALLAAGAVAMTAFVAPTAHALFMGCNTDQATTGQGVTFCFTQTDSDTFTFEIKNALSATGDWTGASALAGFNFKDLGVDFIGGVGATATYLGTPYIGANEQLNATLCSTTGSPDAAICFGGHDFPGLNLALTNDMVFTIDITGGGALNIASTGPHLQIAFMDELGCTETAPATMSKPTGGGGPPVHCKLGSLYSRNIASSSGPSSSGPSSSGPSSSGPGLPEPGTLALLGVALAGLAVLRRRRRADRLNL